MTPLEAEVLATVTPTPQAEDKLARIVADLLAAATGELAALKIAGRTTVQGSVAKGTWLAGATDIDMFLLLDPALPLAELERVALTIGPRLLSAPQKKYAQHPYMTGKFQGHTVDLVPAYAVPSATAKMSAVDRTPFHTAWVRDHLAPPKRGDVRLLKQWMKGVGIYGAQTANAGFSGYLVEILVVRFGPLRVVLDYLAAGAKPRRVSLGRDEVKDEVSPLVVVDPVDPGRNCAAAVSAETLQRAQEAATEYLKTPRRTFFFPAPPRAEPATTLHAGLARENSAWLGVLLRPRTDRLDIVFPQFQKAGRSLESGLVDAGFAVRRCDVASADDGKEILMQWVVAVATLPERRVHEGPREASRHAARFREKWASHPDARSPIRSVDGVLQVDVAVHVRTPAAWLERVAGETMGKHVQEAWTDRRLLTDPGAVPVAWAPRVADLALARRSWQR